MSVRAFTESIALGMIISSIIFAGVLYGRSFGWW
jgi:hypothetical protein